MHVTKVVNYLALLLRELLKSTTKLVTRNTGTIKLGKSYLFSARPHTLKVTNKFTVISILIF